MIEMLVKPSAQDISDRLGQVPPSPFIPRIRRVAQDAEIGLRAMRQRLRRRLFGITLVRHPRVRVRHHGRPVGAYIRFRASSIPHRSGVVGRWGRKGMGRRAGAHVVRRGVGIGAREGAGVGERSVRRVHSAVWEGLQVPNGRQDGAGPARGVGGRR